jgi:hypothetical protein
LKRIKVQPNDSCPCGSGRKFKRCCSGKIDWTKILRSGEDYRQHLSIRGRNLLFADAISDALGFDPNTEELSLAAYKNAFTVEAVRKIYEAVIAIWPPDTKIQPLLERTGADVSGLYIGDYDSDYVRRALVRHSIYANKILLVDPFIHPYVVRDEFNPIENPAQYRAQTLRNVNLYLSVFPWIEAGIVEFIRTPADFDRRLNADATRRAAGLRREPELQAALQSSVRDLEQRHSKRYSLHMALLSAPDSYLKRIFRELKLEQEKLTESDFIDYVNSLRERDPDFLAPLGPNNPSQLHMVFAGGTYEMARLSAQMAGSYLFTDLKARWALIEHDRANSSAESKVWSPFAKAVQNTKLHFLNNLELHHALKLRQEGRLESLRSLLTSVWEKARGEEPFDEAGAIHLANHLVEAVDDAEAEWRHIQKDLVKIVGTSLSAGTLSAGPTIAAGHALWLAAAAIIGTVGVMGWSGIQTRAYLKKHPAAFFMDLREE